MPESLYRPRPPYNEESFDDSFSYVGMDQAAVFPKTTAVAESLRKEAALLAMEWILRDGYFNGEIKTDVTHHGDRNEVEVKVTLRCFGLPSNSPIDEPTVS